MHKKGSKEEISRHLNKQIKNKLKITKRPHIKQALNNNNRFIRAKIIWLYITNYVV
jgi:hypothetical protein